MISPRYNRRLPSYSGLDTIVAGRVVAATKPKPPPEPDPSMLNRKDRRARLRRLGYSWAQARELGRQREAEERRLAHEKTMEQAVAAKAGKLSPDQAREALARWAARGDDDRSVRP